MGRRRNLGECRHGLPYCIGPAQCGDETCEKKQDNHRTAVMGTEAEDEII